MSHLTGLAKKEKMVGEEQKRDTPMKWRGRASQEEVVIPRREKERSKQVPCKTELGCMQ